MTTPPQGPPAGYPPAPPPQPYGQAMPVPMPYAGGHPVQLTIERAAKQSRVLALFSIPFFLIRIIAAIPVLICLYVMLVIAEFAAWFGQWAILFSGHNPEGLHSLVTGVLRWTVRTQAFVLGVTDKYPGFGWAP
jgi:uncharacterized membrane protein